MDASRRVILNTAVNYASLIIKMAVGLFSVRFILKALGESDYGLYVAVAGVVGLLDILNSNMTNTSMRFMSHSLGSGDLNVVKKTFNSTLFIHYMIGIATIIIMEIGGLIILEYVLNIPTEKMFDAHVIFQFMVITMFISVIAVPYDAVMNAHERIWMLSVFDVIGAVLTLGLAIYLLYCGGDRLIQYGLGLMLIQIVLRICKTVYSKQHFEECRNVSMKQRDRAYLKSILSFTGWNLLGSIASAFALHIRGIIINIFFGVRLNASEGISRRINNYVNMVSVSMTKAINPQLMKSEGGGDRQRMLRVTEIASKYSSFLFALVGVPFAIESPYLIGLWLEEVPEFAVVFCQLSLINLLISKYSFQIVHAIHAVGIIRDFQLVETFFCLLPLPIAYFMFKGGASPETIYYIGLLMNIPVLLFRFYFGKKITGMEIGHFIKSAILTTLIPMMISLIFTFAFVHFVPECFARVLGTFLLFGALFTALFWIIGIDKAEKDKWLIIIKPMLSRVAKR